jgi:hypothetical protein
MSLAAFLPSVFAIIEKIIPDKQAAAAAKLKVLELEQQGELAKLEAVKALNIAQTEINKAEATNPNLFVSGWRPAIGWVSVSGVGYSFVLRPLLSWIAPLVGLDIPPPLDTAELFTLLMGMLGLGGLRTYERLNGVIPKGK